MLQQNHRKTKSKDVGSRGKKKGLMQRIAKEKCPDNKTGGLERKQLTLKQEDESEQITFTNTQKKRSTQ